MKLERSIRCNRITDRSSRSVPPAQGWRPEGAAAGLLTEAASLCSSRRSAQPKASAVKLSKVLDKAMFAIVRTGGKQYRVAAGDKIVVEKLAGEAGDTVTLGDILLAGEGGDLRKTDGLTVSAEIIAQAKGDKVTVFKKKRRHNYRRKRGHRQQHTILRILAIGDQKAAPKKAAAQKPASEESAPEKAADAKPAKKAAPKPSEAPAKIEGAESEMTDTPAAKKPAKETGAAKAKAEAPVKKEGKASELTDTPDRGPGQAPAAPKKKASTKKPAADKNA